MGECQGREQNALFDADEAAVLRSFVACDVRFIVVGGRAVQFHGHLRPAKDLDLLVEFSEENWERLGRALRPLNAGVTAFATLSPEKRYQARLTFYPTVEFLTAIDGVSFASAWMDAVATIIDSIPVRVLCKAHLITSKKMSKRPLDARDVEALRSR
jgi:hypothetical protein